MFEICRNEISNLQLLLCLRWQSVSTLMLRKKSAKKKYAKCVLSMFLTMTMQSENMYSLCNI